MEPCLFELFQDGGQVQSSGDARFTVREPGSCWVIIHEAIGGSVVTNQLELVEGRFEKERTLRQRGVPLSRVGGRHLRELPDAGLGKRTT